MSILSILDELAATSSRNDKIKILKNHQDNEVLKEILKKTYDQHIVFYIKQIPEYIKNIGAKCMGYAEAFTLLNQLETRHLTGHAARDLLKHVLESMYVDDSEVICRMISGNLECGINTSTINKVFPNLVSEFEVMLAGSNLKKIVFPAYSQVKADGVRCHMSLSGDKPVCYSRNGNYIETFDHFDVLAKSMFTSGSDIIDGELVCYIDDKPMPRKQSNGIINKAIRGTITEEEAKMIRFVTWDIVDKTGTIPYKERLAMLRNRVNLDTSGKIAVIETVVVNNIQEADEHFEKCIANGDEGTLLKNMDHPWENKRSDNQCKRKKENTVDLLVTDILPGTGKNIGKIGAVSCQTSEGKLKVNVGIFMGDESIREKDLKGNIIEVMYNEKIQDESGEWSLFLPRMVKIRHDKNVADSFEDVK